MTIRIIILVAAIISALLAFTWFGSGVLAAECFYTMDSAIADIQSAQGFTYVIVEGDKVAPLVEMAEAVTGGTFAGVTRVLVAQLNGLVGLGLEIGECLTPPIFVNLPPNGTPT